MFNNGVKGTSTSAQPGIKIQIWLTNSALTRHSYCQGLERFLDLQKVTKQKISIVKIRTCTF